MAFIDIYNPVSGMLGLTAADKKAFVKSIINAAAEDLYTQSDLVNCLREQVFSRPAELTAQPIVQYTLPWYVDKVRAIREYTAGLKVNLHDTRPRFQTQGWQEFFDPNVYRIKTNVVLSSHILNEGTLTLRLPDGEVCATEFSITITGSGASISRISETVTMQVGDSEVTTTKLFSTVDSIRKANVTTFDLYVFDADDREISFIPNDELSPRFTLIQFSDYAQSNTEYLEFLFKIKFTPFNNDSDEFPCGNIYDRALIYKSAEYYYTVFRKDFSRAKDYFTKAAEACKNVTSDFADGQDVLIDFGPNQYLNMVPNLSTRSPLNNFNRFYLRSFRGT